MAIQLAPILISAGISLGTKLLSGALGGAKGAVSANQGPANPHLQHPTTYAMSNQAAYVAGRGFRPR